MYTVAVMLYSPGVLVILFIAVAKKVTHQSMVHACALQQSINRRSIVGHSVDQWNVQLSTMHLSSKCSCCSMVSGSNIKQSIVKACILLTNELLVVRMSNHRPSIDQLLECASVNH